MANFHAISRSNYVKVKDVEKATESLKCFGNRVHVHDVCPNYIMIEGGEAGFETYFCDDENELKNRDWREWCMTHLCTGQVLILVTVGNEGLRYVAAGSEAYTWDGRCIQFNLMDTLSRGLQDIGVNIQNVALPQYTEISTWEPGQE